ncbi:DUF192 domain-containing protein [Sphingomonas japonica]|uniref:DUF192 domain-containing protein n=1 Tax=Sphingomonas japonica TaxID=511662 RepID=A0ABX0U1J5_9SPHN|nr:DUF192 domain-containing protein [Sphingomonas japonica]NIJ24428.1 hypothetical protein [Sphingomonas japonica]
MRASRRVGAALAAAFAIAGCSADGTSNSAATAAAADELVEVTITTADGDKRFRVETARTAAEQAQGLMYRTDIPDDGGMLFHPYPPDGTGPREASFWMKNTPTPLDLLFIRADGSIARIAENAAPFSEAQIRSGEPIAAVLELKGGKAAENLISPGDKVRFAGGPGT